MSVLMDHIRERHTALKMKNTLTILDNYLERAVKDEPNIVEVLDHKALWRFFSASWVEKAGHPLLTSGYL